ncbi:MAG TPA: alkaline phosphatase family protein [Acidimicrobiia bacterium]|jgi:predicted AlkP superfamily pyrophosphatase or phosphodiesterase
MSAARVFFLILDAFDPVRLSPHVTPNLWRWANADGAATGVGRSVMASCTYPNHASFVTGVRPSEHGIWTNHVIREGQVSGAWEAGPSAPTLFDSYGSEAIAILGDHHLVGVMGAKTAASHWPPGGELTPDIALDPLGYPADEAVLPYLVEALGTEARLVIGYLGSIDTYSHIYGPGSDEAASAYRRVDDRIGQLEEAIDWARSAIIVVSDHVQDPAAERPGIDLRSVLGDETIVVDEGSAALIGPTADPGVLHEVDGVEGWEQLADGNVLAWCGRGRYFGSFDFPLFRGVHGGAHTLTQLALVSGGHPARSALAATVNAGEIPAESWAGAIAGVLG